MAMPAALARALDELQASVEGPAADRLLYSGNRHDAVPRALLFDRRLTPLERNAWQLLRLQVNPDGITAVRTYDHLRPHLAAMPCGAQASHETIARVLSVLRLTRWLSLVQRRRDVASGRLLGNVYVLHEEPLTPFEAMHLDAEYLNLVSQALHHASATVQRVGTQVLQEIAEDPRLHGRVLPSRLDALMHRTHSHPQADATYPHPESEHGLRDSEEGVRESEEGLAVTESGLPSPSSDSEQSEIPRKSSLLRNPNKDSTVRTVRTKAVYKEVRTVPRARATASLQLPAPFLDLDQAQQTAALIALQPVDVALQQAVLDEWALRCRNRAVRNPTGYLFGIIQKALRGEFKPWASQIPLDASAPTDVSNPHPTPSSTRADPEIVQAHLARLRDLLRST